MAPPLLYKTWQQFQIYFILAYKEMCSDQLEADKLGYGDANAVAIQGAEEVLANLAAVTVIDQVAFNNLITDTARIS